MIDINIKTITIDSHSSSPVFLDDSFLLYYDNIPFSRKKKTILRNLGIHILFTETPYSDNTELPKPTDTQKDASNTPQQLNKQNIQSDSNKLKQDTPTHKNWQYIDTINGQKNQGNICHR